VMATSVLNSSTYPAPAEGPNVTASTPPYLTIYIID
jgi:hypothetical protein